MQGKKRFISLLKTELEALKLGFKKSKSSTFRQRCHYILLSHQGKSMTEISLIYAVSYQTIWVWLGRYEKGGIKSLHTAKGRGRPSIFRIDNKEEGSKILNWVSENPQNLKITLAKMEKELGINSSKRSLIRYLEKKSGHGSVLEKKCQQAQTQNCEQKNVKH